jgi:hypothetical protein
MIKQRSSDAVACDSLKRAAWTWARGTLQNGTDSRGININSDLLASRRASRKR